MLTQYAILLLYSVFKIVFSKLIILLLYSILKTLLMGKNKKFQVIYFFCNFFKIIYTSFQIV